MIKFNPPWGGPPIERISPQRAKTLIREEIHKEFRWMASSVGFPGKLRVILIPAAPDFLNWGSRVYAGYEPRPPRVWLNIVGEVDMRKIKAGILHGIMHWKLSNRQILTREDFLLSEIETYGPEGMKLAQSLEILREYQELSNEVMPELLEELARLR